MPRRAPRCSVKLGTQAALAGAAGARVLGAAGRRRCGRARAQVDLLVNVAPKKPNWDLRRDVAKKLEKLERRTQRAIVQLLQQEQRGALEAGGGQAD